jgi:hypothetical protein
MGVMHLYCGRWSLHVSSFSARGPPAYRCLKVCHHVLFFRLKLINGSRCLSSFVVVLTTAAKSSMPLKRK